MSSFFKVLHNSTRSKARLGLINTTHGEIKTPAFVPVATKGTLKSLVPNLTKEIGIQVAFVNTYHLVTHPGEKIIEKAGKIHNFSRLQIPLMSDSGGFQVFSLAKRDSDLKSGRKVNIRGEEQPLLVKISDDGVIFRSIYDGSLIEFTPEKSIEYQNKIGADLIMSFDECTYYPATHEYTKKAMDRTHNWLLRCIKQFKSVRNSRSKLKSEKQNTDFNSFQPISTDCNSQALYGIIQGGTFSDLRKTSAEFVTSQNVDGIAIGGVSVGETKIEMREQVKWVADYLPANKPVHLLGVGHVDDILDLVKYGIDTFDCVEPTRVARMGSIFQSQQILNLKPKNYELDITKSLYRQDLSAIDENCSCYVCKNFTKSYLHHLFKQKEILGYSLATYHNLWVMEKLFEKIRSLIGKNKL